MNEKQHNKLERLSVIIEEKLEVLDHKAHLLATMTMDYLYNCYCEGKNINAEKLISYANRIQKLTADGIKLTKQLDVLENKFGS
jgi:hypothetical protein